MPIRVEGLNDLTSDIARLAQKADVNGGGAATAKAILQQAAVPIHVRMKANASSDPQIISGALYGAINIGPVRRKGRGPRITIGVHRKDWNGDEEYYSPFVEYGHAGPSPAPPHPYIRPAFDTEQDAAYQIIRDGLRDMIKP